MGFKWCLALLAAPLPAHIMGPLPPRAQIRALTPAAPATTRAPHALGRETVCHGLAPVMGPCPARAQWMARCPVLARWTARCPGLARWTARYLAQAPWMVGFTRRSR